jgi:hypothetical protein
MSKRLLKPGTLAVCRSDCDGLIIWSSYNCDYEDDIGKIFSDDLLIIIEARKPTTKEIEDEYLTPEWMNGAYKVLLPNGKSGWTGEGWLIPISSSPS